MDNEISSKIIGVALSIGKYLSTWNFYFHISKNHINFVHELKKISMSNIFRMVYPHVQFTKVNELISLRFPPVKRTYQVMPEIESFVKGFLFFINLQAHPHYAHLFASKKINLGRSEVNCFYTTWRSGIFSVKQLNSSVRKQQKIWLLICICISQNNQSINLFKAENVHWVNWNSHFSDS